MKNEKVTVSFLDLLLATAAFKVVIEQGESRGMDMYDERHTLIRLEKALDVGQQP